MLIWQIGKYFFKKLKNFLMHILNILWKNSTIEVWCLNLHRFNQQLVRGVTALRGLL